MSHRPPYETSKTDHEHCETLALAIIVRGVLDLNSSNDTIRIDAENFLSLDNPMFLYYVSAVANESNDIQLANTIIDFAKVGDTSLDAMQQRTVFGNKISQAMNAGSTINKARQPDENEVLNESRSKEKDFDF